MKIAVLIFAVSLAVGIYMMVTAPENDTFD